MITVEISSKTNTMNEDLEQAERKDCVLTRLLWSTIANSLLILSFPTSIQKAIWGAKHPKLILPPPPKKR